MRKSKREKILGKALCKKLPPGAIVDNKHQANKKVLEQKARAYEQNSWAIIIVPYV